MTHIMLDIETWGKKPGCDIRSIGATVFDPMTGYTTTHGDGVFYIATSNPVPDWYFGKHPDTNRKYPLTRDPETVEWWSNQSKEAQAAFAKPVDLREALITFTAWIALVSGEPNTGAFSPNIRLWANDPHFDECILAMAYAAIGLVEPWHYRSPRSMKTALDLAGMTREEMTRFSYGTDHNALDDAISQAMIVCECYSRLKVRK